MFGTSRAPTAQELQELVELTSRDPGSPAFVDLGEAYIALGRPRDAIDVAARGLHASPDSVGGRMMMSRALVLLHEWKQAQAELLKVVKADRNHDAGFVLLGEVLIRRGDYERALPVLQHAQNLDPQNPHVSELLRRARTGEPLDPPPPIPTPGVVLGSPRPPSYMPAAPDPLAGFDTEHEPTRVAQPLTASPAAPTIASQAVSASPTAPTMGMSPYPDPAASPAAPGAAPRPGPAAPRTGPSPAAPSTGAMESAEGGVRPRPRVLPAEKPRDAAHASLRQSAAAGENYLNNLLMAGLLDLPSVRAPEADFEVDAGKRWGRSTRRAFIFLFVLLFAGIGGGGYWFYTSEKQRAEDVARHLADARRGIQSGAYADLEAAVQSTQAALERDPENVAAVAVYAKASSLLTLLYGMPHDSVEMALSTARRAIEESDAGWREVVLARAALTLSSLPRLEEPKAQLKDTRQSLQAWLETHADDAWARWLLGKSLQAAGDYEGALEAYSRAASGDDAPVVARISAADILLDRGDTAEALAGYEAALEAVPQHPLALMGRILLRSETGAEPAEISGEINVHFSSQNYGPRIEAYKNLAMAMASYLISDYGRFAEELDKAEAEAVPEPRYLVRVGHGRVQAGKIAAAVALRAQVGWYGDRDPDPPPMLLRLLDAEFLLAAGLPGEALGKLGDLDNLRALRLRGRALYDQGKAEEAVAQLDAALEIAPDDLESQMWREAARLVAVKTRRDRRDVDNELDKLARGATNKAVRYVHGDALIRIGRKVDARRRLEASIDEITPEHPNPLAYRAHAALAELEFEQGQIRAALDHLEQAFAQVSAYLPAQALLGRIQVGRGEHDDAYATLSKLMDEPDVISAQTELAFAEAAVSRSGAVSEEEREAARQAVRRAREKGVQPVEELTRVAALVDPALVEELGLQVAPPPGARPGKKKKRGR